MTLAIPDEYQNLFAGMAGSPHQVTAAMARFLVEYPGYSLVLVLGKSLIFQERTADRYFGDWWQQKYIIRRTDEYARYPNANSLGAFRSLHLTKAADWVGRRLPRKMRLQLKSKYEGRLSG
jgi:hypothetical protein